MKLEKLLTLSQLVDSLQEVAWSDWKAIAIVEAYNNFLKQPLIKDMFINPIQKPTDQYSTPQYYECELMAWQDAENKVIFECIEDDMKYFCFEYQRLDSKSLLLNEMKLYDLAEETNGELTLKNVNI